MTKFIMGLLLGLLLGIGGTSYFLITAQGGDYLVMTSPRVRELETQLKQGDQEREWLRRQVQNSLEIVTKLETRFLSLAQRFEDLAGITARPTQRPSIASSGSAPKASGDSQPTSPTEPRTNTTGISAAPGPRNSQASPDRKGQHEASASTRTGANPISTRAGAKDPSVSTTRQSPKKVVSPTQPPAQSPGTND